MNNLYSKVAVASVGIALAFALEANKEVKAATIILTPATSFTLTDGNGYYGGVPFHVGINNTYESRAFYEFNVGSLSLPSNTAISKAIFRVRADSIYAGHRSFAMNIMGYIGNGQPDYSDYEAFHSLLTYTQLGSPPEYRFNYYFNDVVTPFVNDLISKNNAFAGFRVQVANSAGYLALNDRDARLIITTVDVAEPVPEPTTIFGSAIALGVGGWLKRKNSSRSNKTTLQR